MDRPSFKDTFFKCYTEIARKDVGGSTLKEAEVKEIVTELFEYWRQGGSQTFLSGKVGLPIRNFDYQKYKVVFNESLKLRLIASIRKRVKQNQESSSSRVRSQAAVLPTCLDRIEACSLHPASSGGMEAVLELRAKTEAIASAECFPSDLPRYEFGSKALIHILGDRVGRGSGFEGVRDDELLIWAIGFASIYQTQAPSGSAQEELLKIVATLQRSYSLVDPSPPVTEQARKYTAAIDRLEVGESLLVFAGFINHSVIFEFARAEDRSGKRSFHLHKYDASSEGKIYSSIESIYFYEKKMTRVSYLNIPEDKILFGIEKAAFLELIIGVKRDQTEIDDIDPLLESVCADLGESFEEKSQPYFRIQQSGTCIWRSYLAWLHFQFKDIEDYKLFVTWMQKETLLRAYLAAQSNRLSFTEFRILENSLRELQIHTAMRLSKHRTSRVYESAALLSLQLAPHIKKMAEDYFYPRTLVLQDLRLESIEGKIDFTVLSSIYEEGRREVVEGKKTAIADFYAPTDIKVSSFSVLLREMRERFSHVDQDSYLDGVSTFFINLNGIDELARDLISSGFPLENLQDLVFLEEVLLKSKNQSHQLAGFKVLAIAHSLILEQIDDRFKKLYREQKFPNFLNQWLDRNFLMITDSKELERICELKDYFTPYTTSLEKKEFLPLSQYGYSYIARDHHQAIVQFAYRLYDSLTLDERLRCLLPEDSTTAVIKILNEKFRDQKIDEPLFLPFLFCKTLFYSYCPTHIKIIGQYISYPGFKIISAFESPTYCRVSFRGHIEREWELSNAENQFDKGPLIHLKGKEKEVLRDHKSEETVIISDLKSAALKKEIERIFLTACTNPKVMPSYLLLQLLEKKEELKDFRVLKYLTSLLFACYKEQDGSLYSSILLSLDDKEFRKLYARFVRETLVFFSARDFADELNHQAAIALISQAILVSKNIKDLEDRILLEREIEGFIQFFQKEATSLNDKKLYALVSLALVIFKKEINAEDAKEVLKRWFLFKAYDQMILEQTQYVWFSSLVDSAFYENLNSLKMHTDESILESIFSFHGLEFSKIKEIEAFKAPNVGVILKDEENVYELDFVTGQFLINQDISSLARLPSFTQSMEFKRVFKSPKNFRTKGSRLIFDSIRKTFSLDLNAIPSYWYEGLKIHYDGREIDFINPEKLAELPLNFSRRYLFFVDREKEIIRGFNFESFEEEIQIHSSEVFNILTHERIFSVERTSTFLSELTSYKKLELVRKPNGCVSIKAATFKTVDETLFEMVYEEEKTKWRHSLKLGYYYTRDEVSKFGKLNCYLKFSNDEGKAFYYLPLYDWKIKKGYSSYSDEIEPQLPTGLGVPCALDGLTYLLEYFESSTGSLEPQSQEALCYLASIYLMQKRFDLFSVYLQKMDQEDEFSKASSEILVKLINFLDKNIEGSPDFIVFSTRLISSTIYKIKVYQSDPCYKFIAKIYESYLQVFPRLDKTLKLSLEEELKLAIFLNRAERISYLREGGSEKKIIKRMDLKTTRYRLNKPKDLFSIPSFFCPISRRARVNSTVGFPWIVSKKLTESTFFFDQAKTDLTLYAKSISRKEELDHFKYFLDLQFKYCVSEMNFYFLIYLKALYNVKASEILGSGLAIDLPTFSNFDRHVNYLMGIEPNITISVSSDISQISKEIHEDYVKFFNANFEALKFFFIAKPKFEESEEFVPQTRKVDLTHKFPPALSLLKEVRLEKIDFLESLRSLLVISKKTLVVDLEEKVGLKLSRGRNDRSEDREYQLFLRDFSAGLERVTTSLEFSDDLAVYEGIDHLVKIRGEISKISHEKKQRIEQLLNFRLELSISEKLLLESKVKKTYTIQDGIYLFLTNRGFESLNPDLSPREILILINEIGNYLVYETEIAQINRILEARESRNQELIAAEISKIRAYDPHEDPVFLVFEYGMNIRLTLEQVRILKIMLQGDREKYNEIALELQMGKGKTSVFATILSVLASTKTKGEDKGFGLYITPKAQIETVKKSLKTFLSKTFNKKLYHFDFSKTQIDKEQVLLMVHDLNIAIDLGYPVVTSPESLQFLELEFLKRLGNLSIESSGIEKELVSLLRDLYKKFRNQSHAIIDEVDLVIDTKKLVNFPLGEARPIESERAFLVKLIFLTILEFDSDLQISRNLQSEVDPARYESLKRDIALKLVGKLPFLEMGDPLLIDFIAGELNEPLSEDARLFIEKWQEIKIKEPKKAMWISLLKHSLCDVLPHILTKSYGRDYGRILDKSSFKIAPYQSVDTPQESSEFGYYLESAFYHMASAVQAKIEKDRLLSFYEHMKKKAILSKTKMGISIEETREAKTFKEITGCQLVKFHIKEESERVYQKFLKEKAKGQFINLLSMEEEMIEDYVSMRQETMTTGAQGLMDIFLSARMFSATPWNVETVVNDLDSIILRDEGGLGEFAATLISRESDRESKVHVLEEISVHAIFLNFIVKRKKIDLILDPSGLFKEKSNLEVATEIKCELLKDNPQNFKGVLFFQRKSLISMRNLFEVSSSEDAQDLKRLDPNPDSIAFLPLDRDEIIYFSSSRIESFREKGLEPEDCFIYLDQRHTTGIDLPLREGARATILNSTSLTYPRFMQALGRLRKFKKSQDVEICVARSYLEKLGDVIEPKVVDIVKQSIKALSEQKKAVMYDAFCQRVDQISRNVAIKILLTSPEESLKENFDKFRSLFVTSFVDNPIEQFGFLIEEGDSRDLLINRYRKKVSVITHHFPDYKSYFDEKLEELCREMRVNPYLQDKEKVQDRTFMSMQHETEQEFEVKLFDISPLDPELLTNETSSGYKQKKWDRGLIIRTLENLKSRGLDPYVKPISESLIDPFLEKIPNLRSFSGILSDDLYVSENFSHVYEVATPLFHKASKRVVCGVWFKDFDSRYRVILISKEELGFFKDFVSTHKHLQISITDKFGNNLLEFDDETFKDARSEEVSALLLQMNAVSGNIDYLARREDETKKWLSSRRGDKLKFLKYAIYANQRENEIVRLKLDPLFSESDQINEDEVFLDLLKSENVHLLSDEEIQNISKDYAHLVPREKIYLLNKKEQIEEILDQNLDMVTLDQINLLSTRQISLIEDKKRVQKITNLELLLRLTDKALDKLSVEQIRILLDFPEVIRRFGGNSAKILERLDPSKTVFLEKAVAIQALSTIEGINEISVDKFSYLNKEQYKYLQKEALINEVNELDLGRLDYSILSDRALKLIIPRLKFEDLIQFFLKIKRPDLIHESTAIIHVPGAVDLDKFIDFILREDAKSLVQFMELCGEAQINNFMEKCGFKYDQMFDLFLKLEDEEKKMIPNWCLGRITHDKHGSLISVQDDAKKISDYVIDRLYDYRYFLFKHLSDDMILTLNVYLTRKVYDNLPEERVRILEERRN
jgi:hypothetical protein